MCLLFLVYFYVGLVVKSEGTMEAFERLGNEQI